jgi:hypothetical protein
VGGGYPSVMRVEHASLEALRNMIEQVEILISTTVELPENRTARCQELLKAARSLTDDLLGQAGQ